jgi:hypothetical protein
MTVGFHFHFVLSPKDLRRLRDLAEHGELTQAAYLRALIRREWEGTTFDRAIELRSEKVTK